MNKAQEIIEKIKRERELRRYRNNKQSLGLGNLGNVASKLFKSKKAVAPVTSLADSGSALSNATKMATSIDNVSDLANTGNALSDATKMATTVGKTADTASKASKVAGMAGKAGTALGAVGSGVSAVNDFSNGNYIDGSLNAAKAIATVVPGGQPIALAIQAGQMIKDAINSKKQKAMQANLEKMQENDQYADEQMQKNMENFGNDSLAINTMPQAQQGYVGQLPQLGGTTAPQPEFQPALTEQAEPEVDVPTGFASGTEDNKLDLVSKIMGLVGQSKGVEGELPTLKNNNPSWDENTLNAMDKARGLGLDQGAIDGVAQGLNGGNKDVAGIVDEFGIRKPSTEEEIALAREGKFNSPTMPEATVEEATEEPSLKDKIKNKFVSGVKDLKAGFDDNVSTSLAEGDLLNGIVGEEGVPTSGGDAVKKGIMNRIGELAGTTVRTLGKPAVQGLIAGGISRAHGNDWGNAIETGLDYAQRRQVADHYYKALNPEAKFTPLFSGLGADDYKAHTMNEYRDAMVENARLKAEAQLDKTNPTLEDYARSMRLYGAWTEDQYNSFIASPEYLANPKARINNEVQKGLVAQQNADTNSRKAEDLNAHYQRMDALKAQANQIDAQYKQGMLSKYERDQQLKVIDQQLKATEVQIKLAKENREQYVAGQMYKGYTPNANISTGNIAGNTTGNTTSNTVTIKAGGKTMNLPADKLEAFLQKAEDNNIKVEVL